MSSPYQADVQHSDSSQFSRPPQLPPQSPALRDLADFSDAAGGDGRGLRPRPPKLYRIGEVVDYSGMSRQTIHNYTTMGLLHESRWTRGGHRLYDESVFERLDKIAELKAANGTLQDIRAFFAKIDVQ